MNLTHLLAGIEFCFKHRSERLSSVNVLFILRGRFSVTQQNAEERIESGDKRAEEFAALSEESHLSLIAEFWFFLKENKKWWLVPLLVTIGLYGFFLVASLYGGPAFIYAIF